MKHLRDVLDRKNYSRLVNTFGGSRLWIPKSGNLGHRERKFFRLRNSRIRKLRRRGYNVERLAGLFSLSPKRIYSIIGGNVKTSAGRRRQLQ